MHLINSRRLGTKNNIGCSDLYVYVMIVFCTHIHIRIHQSNHFTHVQHYLLVTYLQLKTKNVKKKQQTTTFSSWSRRYLHDPIIDDC